MLITIKGKLVAKENDLEYTNLVFKNLDQAPFGHNYSLMTVCPNWESRIPEIGEIGYVTYKDATAGIDTWYNPTTGERVPYKYTNIYFIKFVKEKDNLKKDIIL